MRSLERNVLKFVGIKPVERTLIGGVNAEDDRCREWLEEMAALGAAGE